jgi:hypothetical protein
MPPEGIYRVAYQVAETVSATWRSQHTDSAPVRVTLRARPNSFSAALRTSASHALRLSDVARENLLGRARVSAPRQTGADSSNPTVPHRSRTVPPVHLPLRYNSNSALWPRPTRAQWWASLTDRSLHQAREHSARHGGPPMPTNHVTILGTLASARTCRSCKPTAAGTSTSSA